MGRAQQCHLCATTTIHSSTRSARGSEIPTCKQWEQGCGGETAQAGGGERDSTSKGVGAGRTSGGRYEQGVGRGQHKREVSVGGAQARGVEVGQHKQWGVGGHEQRVGGGKRGARTMKQAWHRVQV